VGPVNGFLSWWDGVELWLSGLPFVLQALAVMPVVLVMAYFLAALLDSLLGRGTELMRRARHSDEASG
jgi:membrane protein implicated in regulation of membrane protease activity